MHPDDQGAQGKSPDPLFPPGSDPSPLTPAPVSVHHGAALEKATITEQRDPAELVSNLAPVCATPR